jgi:hypothetical protein
VAVCGSFSTEITSLPLTESGTSLASMLAFIAASAVVFSSQRVSVVRSDCLSVASSSRVAQPDIATMQKPANISRRMIA